MIEPGTPAPDFKLRDQDGQKVTLESLRGQTTVLVFYPSDFSPVCTDQLNVYQEVLGEMVNARTQERDLHLGRPRVGLGLPEPLDYLPLGLDGQAHRRRTVARTSSTSRCICSTSASTESKRRSPRSRSMNSSRSSRS